MSEGSYRLMIYVLRYPGSKGEAILRVGAEVTRRSKEEAVREFLQQWIVDSEDFHADESLLNHDEFTRLIRGDFRDELLERIWDVARSVRMSAA
jgi:hypothetical protein